MSNFGEQLPQEDCAYAREQLVREIESRMHPKEGFATLAVCDGIVAKITDEGASYRIDIHGVLPSELKPGEAYRSIQVGKPSAVNYDGMSATMSIVTKFSDYSFTSDVAIDDNGRPLYLERRYDANWGIRYLDEPQASIITEMNGKLARSSSVFLPEEELYDMFAKPSKVNYRKWQSLTQPESSPVGNSKLQKFLSRLALLRS